MKLLSILVSCLAIASTCLAQTRSAAYVIRSVEPSLIPTPEFQFQGTQRRTGRVKEWLEVEVAFETQPEWTDELTLRYFILVAGKCLTGEVVHVNVPRARDLRSVMYVSPHTLARLFNNKALSPASIENVGAQLLVKGEVVSTSSHRGPEGAQWWQTLPQVTGVVLNKNATPFAWLYWDRYEAIRSADP